jgi:hypothetical protein
MSTGRKEISDEVAALVFEFMPRIALAVRSREMTTDDHLKAALWALMMTASHMFMIEQGLVTEDNKDTDQGHLMCDLARDCLKMMSSRINGEAN